MPLVFSPLSEEILDPGPRSLFPRSVFIMRQLGAPPDLDGRMVELATDVFRDAEFNVMDATSSTGAKDFLERILGLIRGAGFVAAVFSNSTRRTAFANISLELGFAAMCGKPLVIMKPRGADAPSDLTRTDWIEYDQYNEGEFRVKIEQAIQEIFSLVEFEKIKLEIALDAERMDCAIAFERARKAFLLSGEQALVDRAQTILDQLDEVHKEAIIDDIERQRQEIELFIRQARRIEPDAGA